MSLERFLGLEKGPGYVHVGIRRYLENEMPSSARIYGDNGTIHDPGILYFMFLPQIARSVDELMGFFPSGNFKGCDVGLFDEGKRFSYELKPSKRSFEYSTQYFFVGAFFSMTLQRDSFVFGSNDKIHAHIDTNVPDAVYEPNPVPTIR